MTRHLIQINSRNVSGENGTGFEKRGELGEEACGNCEYFRAKGWGEKYSIPGSCGQEDMVKVSQQPMDDEGRREVGDGDCCEYVHRVGRAEYGGKTKVLKSPIKR